MRDMGPDERVYTAHAEIRYRRTHAERYLASAASRDYPSPIRWGWSLCLRSSKRAALFFAFVAAGLTLAVSPLLVHLARRRLQDTAVAAMTIACVLAARVHGDWALALAFAGLLALKPEGALLAVPAIALAFERPWTPALGAMAAGVLAYVAATHALFGPHLAARLWGALAQPHDNEYGRTHQRGMWHRLFVDLALVSPVAVAAGLWYHPAEAAPALALVVAHALTPVRNVRTVLAADLLLRAAVLPMVPWWVWGPWFVTDFWIAHCIRGAKLYDTPTNELTRALTLGPR